MKCCLLSRTKCKLGDCTVSSPPLPQFLLVGMQAPEYATSMQALGATSSTLIDSRCDEHAAVHVVCYAAKGKKRKLNQYLSACTNIRFKCIKYINLNPNPEIQIARRRYKLYATRFKCWRVFSEQSSICPGLKTNS